MSKIIVKPDPDLSTEDVDSLPLPFPLIRTAYDGLNVEFSNKSAIDFDGEISLTKQSFADECDILNIMDRFENTGELPISSLTPRYGDFSMLPEFMEAQNFLIQAQQTFEALPSKIRDRFNNDPAAFLAYADDPENHAEMRALGLLPPVEEVPNPSATPAAGDPQGAQNATGGASAASA